MAAIFAEGYSLYAHRPGGSVERRRQSGYAQWLMNALGAFQLDRIFEVGCGNGSLLLELGAILPRAELRGIDPSAESVRFAREAGLNVHCGFGEGIDEPVDWADLAFAVNVIEHATDPGMFMTSLLSRVRPKGRALIVCPDGDVPSSELLIFDHLFTFTTKAMVTLAGRLGAAILHTETAPHSLGAFRMFVLGRNGAQMRIDESAVAVLQARREEYLLAWERLDSALGARTRSTSNLTCFGTGETAALLRAYAPETWRCISRFTLDEPTIQSMDGRPVVSLHQVMPGNDTVILLAVRPRDQDRVHTRLSTNFRSVIRWDDLVPD